MAMTLTMTVKTRGHLVLDFAYFATGAVQTSTPLRLATVDGVAILADGGVQAPPPALGAEAVDGA